MNNVAMFIQPVIKSLIEEADAMTKEQHKARRKAFIVKFVFMYMLTPLYLLVFCLLFKYFRNNM